MQNILIHVCIALIVIVGFFIFWGKANGWFKEGGLMYEWWKSRKKE